MWEDPIVAEVHRTRQELAAQFGFDVQAIVADIRKRQGALGSRLVSLAKSAEPGLMTTERDTKIAIESGPDQSSRKSA